MNFVADSTTISAPCSRGLMRYGVANVLSTIRGIPCLWAISESFSKSDTLELGFPSVSVNSALVFSSIALSISS